MRVSTNEIKKIVELRESGLSVREISHTLRIPITTTFCYARNVRIRDEFYERWIERKNSSKTISQEKWNHARETASRFIEEISDRELAIIGTSLYWGEGSKKNFGFTNSDPEMVKVFILFLRRIFHVSNEEFDISLRIFEDLDKKECLNFWSGVTGVSLEEKTKVEVRTGSKKGKLRYGMCRLRVRKSGPILKEMTALIERIGELAKAPVV